MTDGPTDLPDSEATEKLLASMAQQVAQQSRTTALHIAQHDDIEAAAEDKAKAIIDKIRADLQEAHQVALAQATEAVTSNHRRELHQNLTRIAEMFNENLQELTNHHASTLKDHMDALERVRQQNAEQHGREVEDLRAEIRNARDQAQRQREELDEAHTKNLAATAEVLQAERTEHEQQYRQICSDTTAEMTRLLDTALEENNRTTDTKLAETGAAMAQQGQEVNNALAASNAHWRRLTTILIVATAAISAVALAALATALL